jgi:hypothetical protein
MVLKPVIRNTVVCTQDNYYTNQADNTHCGMQPAHQSCHSGCIPRCRSVIGRSPRKRETGALCSSARVPSLVGTSSSLINRRTNGAFSHVSSSASQFAKLLLCARSPTARRTEKRRSKSESGRGQQNCWKTLRRKTGEWSAKRKILSPAARNRPCGEWSLFVKKSVAAIWPLQKRTRVTRTHTRCCCSRVWGEDLRARMWSCHLRFRGAATCLYRTPFQSR